MPSMGIAHKRLAIFKQKAPNAELLYKGGLATYALLKFYVGLSDVNDCKGRVMTAHD